MDGKHVNRRKVRKGAAYRIVKWASESSFGGIFEARERRNEALRRMAHQHVKGHDLRDAKFDFRRNQGEMYLQKVLWCVCEQTLKLYDIDIYGIVRTLERTGDPKDAARAKSLLGLADSLERVVQMEGVTK